MNQAVEYLGQRTGLLYISPLYRAFAFAFTALKGMMIPEELQQRQQPIGHTAMDL